MIKKIVIFSFCCFITALQAWSAECQDALFSTELHPERRLKAAIEADEISYQDPQTLEVKKTKLLFFYYPEPFEGGEETQISSGISLSTEINGIAISAFCYKMIIYDGATAYDSNFAKGIGTISINTQPSNSTNVLASLQQARQRVTQSMSSQPAQGVNPHRSSQVVKIRKRGDTGTSKTLRDEEIKQEYPDLYMDSKEFEKLGINIIMGTFGEGTRVGNWSQGDTKSGNFSYKLRTSHGTFRVYDNDSYKVSNYVSAKKDVSNNLCSKRKHFEAHLKDCGITITRR